MRTASLCVGVVDYEHPAYGAQSRRLKFAVSDAQAFSSYLSSSAKRTGAQGVHARLLDRAATLGGMEAAMAEVSRAGELDLFVLYLAGHGEQGDGQGGWFCLADAAPGRRSLDAQHLSSLLSLVQANQVLVVVDCCHAEALVGGMGYFTSLGGNSARLFVASARRDQFAWEDDLLRRSVLSDVFLRACSTTSPIQAADGMVSVEAALFPYLREQVPLLASAQKQGALQEPVMGGSSCADMALPVVDSKSFGRALTISQTVRRRLRQVLLKGSLAAVLLLVALQTLTYHITADPSGRILVRPGLAATYAITPMALGTETDTGLRVEHLSSSAADVGAIGQGRAWGVASHLDEHGLRPWFSQLAPMLDGTVLARRGLLVNASSAAKIPDELEPPIEQVLFVARLNGELPRIVAKRLYEPLELKTLACSTDRLFDFSVSNVPVASYARDLWWQAVLARGDAALQRTTVLSQVQNSAYRALASKAEEATVADLRHLALSLTILKAHAPVDASLLATLQDHLRSPCRSHAAMALGLLASHPLAQAGEAALLEDLLAFDRDKQGDLPTARQVLARRGLELLAMSQPLHASSMEALSGTLLREDPALDRRTLAHEVLRTAAEIQALPESLVNKLFERLDEPEREHEFGHLAALQLLSRNRPYLAPDAAERLNRWLEANARRLYRMSDVQVASGFLLAARQGLHKDLLQLLVEQLSPDTYFPVPETSYRGELVVAALGEDAGVALARILRHHALPKDVADRLVRLAIGRPDLADRHVIVDGLSARWYEEPPSADAIRQRLLEASSNGRRRELEVEVACARLLAESTVHRESVSRDLIRQWRDEPEPELRAALASVVARIQVPRLGSLSLCGTV